MSILDLKNQRKKTMTDKQQKITIGVLISLNIIVWGATIKLIKDNQQVEQQPSFVIERREPSDREIYYI